MNCPICNKQFSNITPTHLKKHNLSHDEFYNRYSELKQNNLINNLQEINKLRAIERKKKYELNPRLCKNCSKPLPYSSQNKFCNSKCSGLYNSKLRGPHSEQQKMKISEGVQRNLIKKGYKLKPKRGKRSSVFFKKCSNCGKTELLRKVARSPFCDCCRLGEKEGYRKQCWFTFNIAKYPEEFDLETIFKIGFFHPIKNPQGYSRDHLYSREEGFINKIDPKIISHPANCQVITQRQNSFKNIKSSISLENLLDKIEKWEKKYSRDGNFTHTD